VRRREFITLLGGAAAWPLAAHAQQGRMPLVGVLRPNPKEAEIFAEPFRRYMKAIGWEEGRNIRFLFVWADGRIERMPALIGELMGQNVDIVVPFGDPAIRAAQQATQSIPIVAMTDDMVGSRLVASMARPGSNTTGVSILASELDVKRLEILREFVPHARRIAVLGDPSTISTRAQLATAARALGVELVRFEAQSPEEIDRALTALVEAQPEAVNVLASPLLQGARFQIIDRMRDRRLPAIYQWPETADEGGMLAYGPRILLCYRHIVSLIDKVLRGTKPSELPIEQPTKFELVVNLKTASVLGMAISPSLLLRATLSPAVLDFNGFAFNPTQLAQALHESTGPWSLTRGGGRAQVPDGRAPRRLRPRRKRPRSCSAAQQRDELAASHHSITSSARASSVGGTVMPSTVAAWTLITSSIFVDCTIGKSSGFVPLRMRPV
jgi:putative ABC transport system substrate-binding protein